MRERVLYTHDKSPVSSMLFDKPQTMVSMCDLEVKYESHLQGNLPIWLEITWN